MRPNTAPVMERTSNFAGKSTRMSIDTSALDHIIGQLTNLYSDPALAVIREYSTNAWDSHRDAGNDAPIKVQLPTELRRNFIVEDFGVGLSAADIEDIYSKYGASTKRDSDDVVGMLGFGCKSALTYCEQFWLRARKDGLETQVSVSKGPTGVGEIDFMSVDVPTDEPNGVQVTIPVRNAYEFVDKANNFFKYWRSGTVLVNGNEPSLGDDVIWLDDDTAVLNDMRVSTDVIVMGNVPYPIEQHKIGYERPLNSHSKFVRWVPIGAVNFPPSRESLHYTQKTVQYIVKVYGEVKRDFAASLSTKLDACATKPEAYRMAVSFSRLLGVYYGYQHNSLSYKGELIPAKATLNDAAYMRLGMDVSTTYELDGCSVDFGRSPVAVIANYDGDKVTSYRRAKIEQAVRALAANVQSIVVAKGSPELGWVEQHTLEWADVNKITFGSGRNETVKYTSYTYGGTNAVFTDETIDKYDGIDVLYYSPAEVREASHRPSRMELRPLTVFGVDKSATVMSLGRNSWKKFEREHDGGFTHVKDWIVEQANNFCKNTPDTVLAALGMDWSVKQSLSALAGQTVDDPELAAMLKELASQGNVESYRNRWNAIRSAASWVGTAIPNLPASKFNLDAYPALSYHRSKHDAAEYVNALYAYRTRKSG